MENTETESSPHPNAIAVPEVPFGERPVSPATLGVCGVFLAFTIAVMFLCRDVNFNRTTSAPASAPAPAHQSQTQTTRPQPTGADAVHPVMQDFIKQAAKDYGISEEEARQAMIKGSRKGYSKEEVERVFGK